MIEVTFNIEMAEKHASFAQVSHQHFIYIILITRGGLDQFITVVNNVMQILAAISKFLK